MFQDNILICISYNKCFYDVLWLEALRIFATMYLHADMLFTQAKAEPKGKYSTFLGDTFFLQKICKDKHFPKPLGLV